MHCIVNGDELDVYLWAGVGGGGERVLVVDWLVDRCSDWQLMAFPVLAW